FLVALVVLIGSLGYIVYDVVIQPLMASLTYTQLAEEYQPENDQPTTSPNYPTGMLSSFEGLYDQNPEVRGWLSFYSTDKKGFLKINYPVVYSGDNEKYLRRDFHGNKSKNGTLFFDMRHVIEPFNHENKVLIIYGHNMASGQMFAGLNKLINRPHNARAATTLTLSTLFEKNDYKVFAAVMTDEDATGAEYFSTLRVKFSSDEDFLGYVEQVRARSLYDYPVDVQAEDELVVLSTCTGKSDAKTKNGRLVVFARRVRQGEDIAVDAAAIVKNEDVIMPLSWYVNQNLQPHDYYTANLPDGSTTSTTQSTPGSTSGSTAQSTQDGTTQSTQSGTTQGGTTQSAQSGTTQSTQGGTTQGGTTQSAQSGTTQSTQDGTTQSTQGSTTQSTQGDATQSTQDDATQSTQDDATQSTQDGTTQSTQDDASQSTTTVGTEAP
ncbi:MAG: class B sortase, partial [Clostridia bacterium]|nr:class B sortase [Clostridia bacterium]